MKRGMYRIKAVDFHRYDLHIPLPIITKPAYDSPRINREWFDCPRRRVLLWLYTGNASTLSRDRATARLTSIKVRAARESD